MRTRFFALLLGGLLVLSLAACSTTARSALAPGSGGVAISPKPIASPETTTEFVATADEVPAAAAPAAEPMPQPCAAPSPMATRPMASYPRCGVPCRPVCGLPCERGCSNWHARIVGGAVFAFGDDTQEDPQGYFGADFGWTSGCCCWGVDAFYRTHCAKFLRNIPVPQTGTTFVGEDGGQFHHLGLKATIERSFCGSPCWFWYAGLGVQYYWTTGFLVEDDSVGGYGELGIGYRFNNCFRIRAGVEGLGQSTNVGRLDPALDNERRFVMFVAPVLQLEFTF